MSLRFRKAVLTTWSGERSLLGSDSPYVSLSLSQTVIVGHANSETELSGECVGWFCFPSRVNHSIVWTLIIKTAGKTAHLFGLMIFKIFSGAISRMALEVLFEQIKFYGNTWKELGYSIR